MEPLKSSLYKDLYGLRHLGSNKPDFARCCFEVVSYHTNWPSYHQCSRKRGHGPDGAYCKQHDPKAVESREAVSKAANAKKWNQERYQWSGRIFFDALLKIAEGHNDARGLAQEVIAKFKEGERE